MANGFSQSLLVAPPEYIKLHAAIVRRLGPSRLPPVGRSRWERWRRQVILRFMVVVATQHAMRPP
jgi:hypothetical protein